MDYEWTTIKGSAAGRAADALGGTVGAYHRDG